MVTIFHHIPVNACIVFKQLYGLNFDSLAGKHQKRQNFPPSKFCTIWYAGTNFLYNFSVETDDSLE